MKNKKSIRIKATFIIFILSIFSINCVFAYDLDNEKISNPIVLITGFEPFDVYDVNPSQLIAEELDGQVIEGAEIVGIVLPVDFEKSVENVTTAIDDYNPILIISIGLSARARFINIENCGLNLKKYPRNESSWILPHRLDPDGPMIRLSTISTKDVVKEIRNADIKIRHSFYAGMYVCNAVLYETAGYIEQQELLTKSGFIHVPLLSSQDSDGMDLETMVNAVKIAIETSV